MANDVFFLGRTEVRGRKVSVTRGGADTQRSRLEVWTHKLNYFMYTQVPAKEKTVISAAPQIVRQCMLHVLRYFHIKQATDYTVSIAIHRGVYTNNAHSQFCEVFVTSRGDK